MTNTDIRLVCVGMFLALIALLMLAVMHIILVRLEEIEERAITRHALFEDWLFTSLYSINNKVLLPDTNPEPPSNKKASIHKPEEDPMYEFKELDL